jgi:hypothetical protein
MNPLLDIYNRVSNTKLPVVPNSALKILNNAELWKVATVALSIPAVKNFFKGPPLFYIEVTAYDQTTMYVFDAVLKTEHVGARRLTQHPVQTGASLTDHSFRIPSRLVMEVGVSDVMSAYDIDKDWRGWATRSISAFQILSAIRDTGQPCTVSTRLKKYSNMVIENISAVEDFRTVNEMRANVTFTEILVAVGVNTTKRSIDSAVTMTSTPPVSIAPIDYGSDNFSSAYKVVN